MEIVSPCTSKQSLSNRIEQTHPFSQTWGTISKEEQINLVHQANYWKAQHAQLKQKNAVLEEEIKYRDAKIKDLQNRLFGKKSEKQGFVKSEQTHATSANRNRGQQPGSQAARVTVVRHGQSFPSSRKSKTWQTTIKNALAVVCLI